MTDDISKVNPYPTGSPEWRQFEKYLRNRRIEPATIPAEVDVPTIDRDEAYQRDYIPLGRSGWEIQTKGKGSTYRICDKEGDRLAIPDVPYLHETLTRMAREVHADYTTLARQLAKSERDCAELRALLTAQNAAIARTDDLARELAEAKAEVESWREDYEALRDAANARNTALVDSLAAAARRLGEVEEVLRQIDAYHGPIRTPIHTITKLRGMARAALNKEPTK